MIVDALLSQHVNLLSPHLPCPVSVFLGSHGRLGDGLQEELACLRSLVTYLIAECFCRRPDDTTAPMREHVQGLKAAQAHMLELSQQVSIAELATELAEARAQLIQLNSGTYSTNWDAWCQRFMPAHRRRLLAIRLLLITACHNDQAHATLFHT